MHTNLHNCLGFLTYTTVTYSEHKTSNKTIVLYIMAGNFMRNSKTQNKYRVAQKNVYTLYSSISLE